MHSQPNSRDRSGESHLLSTDSDLLRRPTICNDVDSVVLLANKWLSPIQLTEAPQEGPEMQPVSVPLPHDAKPQAIQQPSRETVGSLVDQTRGDSPTSIGATSHASKKVVANATARSKTTALDE